jgi:hypothetical protein
MKSCEKLVIIFSAACYGGLAYWVGMNWQMVFAMALLGMLMGARLVTAGSKQ